MSLLVDLWEYGLNALLLVNKCEPVCISTLWPEGWSIAKHTCSVDAVGVCCHMVR